MRKKARKSAVFVLSVIVSYALPVMLNHDVCVNISLDGFRDLSETGQMAVGFSGKAAPKIEITPRMIEAGVHELVHFSPRDDDPQIAVEMIYEAMARARMDDEDSPVRR